MSHQLDVLKIIRKVSEFNGGYIADDLDKCEAVLRDLFTAGRQLSADLEHAIAMSGAVSDEHPVQASLSAFDEALRSAGGAA